MPPITSTIEVKYGPGGGPCEYLTSTYFARVNQTPAYHDELGSIHFVLDQDSGVNCRRALLILPLLLLMFLNDSQ